MKRTAIIGIGAVGAPIAHCLYKNCSKDFYVLTDDGHQEEVNAIKQINGEEFSPNIVTNVEQIDGNIEILILAVKNYDLIPTLELVDKIITDNTIIVPLQNGIWSCRYLRNKYRFNKVAECYVRGPNTKREKDGFFYTKSGVIHIGTSKAYEVEYIKEAYDSLKEAGLDIYYEDNIRLMVWRKWMLNVAGNTVTALTGANYSMFAESNDLQMLCRRIMREFLQVSEAAGVELTHADIDETIDYFVGFQSGKVTSMLEDVLNGRRTENEYIAGEILRMGEEYDIKLPIIRTVYTLMKLKENVYLSNENKL